MKDTKQDIIKISHDLFLLNWYKNTSIDKIIKEVWISKWAFFHYFKDKKSLFLDVMDYFVYQSAPKEFYKVLGKEVAQRNDIFELCKILQSELNQFNFKGWCLLWNMSLELSDIDEFFREKLVDIYNIWEQGIINHIQRIPNFIPKMDPQIIARYIIYSSEWINVTTKVFKDSKKHEQEVKVFLELLDTML